MVNDYLFRMTTVVEPSEPTQSMAAVVKHSKYAQSVDSTMKHPEPEQSVLPLFFRDRALNDNSVMPVDICRAIANVVGSSKLDGAQKINSIWRIYLKDRQARLGLCVKPLSVNGHQVTLLDQNPNVTFSGSGISAQKKDKLTIKSLPLSVSNEEVVKFLKENNIVLASSVEAWNDKG